jgi:Holliday junction resolvasome RuvABC endonuclease subunit
MPQSQPVPKPQPVATVSRNSSDDKRKRKQLWNEEDAVELEEKADAEVKRMDRKRQRLAKKRARATDAADELSERSTAADVIISLDMSTSPGLTIVDRQNPKHVTYTLVGFSQTDRQQTKFDSLSKEQKTPGCIVSTIKKTPVYLRVFRAPKEYANNTEYFELITSKLMDFIRPYSPTQNQEKKNGFESKKTCSVLVVIESYAFHIQSSSVTILAELGGVIRNKLLLAGLSYLEASPTSIKKWFTGSGAADKPKMWKYFQEIAPNIKLDDWLPAAFSETNIPSPHQDIVDAFASAHSLHRDTELEHSIQAYKPKTPPTATNKPK